MCTKEDATFIFLDERKCRSDLVWLWSWPGLNSHHMMIFVRRLTIRSTFFHFTNEQQPWHVLSFAENYVGSNVTHPHIIGIIIIIVMFLANICRSHLFSPFLLLFSPILLLFAFHQRAQGENRPRLSSPLQIDFSTHTTFLFLFSLLSFFYKKRGKRFSDFVLFSPRDMVQLVQFQEK